MKSDVPAEESAASDTVATTIADHKRLTTLNEAIAAAGLTETLSDPSKKFTVLAPNDAAFKKLPEGTLESLLKEENKEKLKNLLLSHVVEGESTLEDLSSGEEGVTTLTGQKLVCKENPACKPPADILVSIVGIGGG